MTIQKDTCLWIIGTNETLEHWKKWNTINDKSNTSYDKRNETFCIFSNTEILKSNLCDYNNAYTLEIGGINIVSVLKIQN